MRIVFCDDEPVFLDRIAEEAEAVLRRLGTEGEVIRCGSGGELMSILRQKSADAVFLDIDMPEMSGFEAADVIHGLPGGTEIVFVSSMDHLVYESFEYRPFWFLRKSEWNRLPEVIEKLRDVLRAKRRLYFFECRGSKLSAEVKDILYFESGNHRVTLHTEGEKWQYKAGIGKVEEELKQYGFARCHAGFLVNCSHISVIKKGSLKLQTGQVIPVSRNRQKETERKFLEYIRSVRL